MGPQTTADAAPIDATHLRVLPIGPCSHFVVLGARTRREIQARKQLAVRPHKKRVPTRWMSTRFDLSLVKPGFLW
jgi:hypothetical protein